MDIDDIIFSSFNPDGTTPTVRAVEFSIADGQVTAMQRVLGTHAFTMPLPANASFTVGNGTVTETIAGTSATEVLQYSADPGNATLYHLASETLTVARPTTTFNNGRTFGYSFTLSNGAVTGLQEVHGNGSHTFSETIPIPPTATFSVSGSTVTETLVSGNAVETISYIASGGGTLYALASDSISFVQAGAAATLLSVEPYERAKFTIDAGGNVIQVQDVRPNGNLVTVTPGSHTSFSQLAPGFVLETVTVGTHNAYEVFHDGNGDGIYTAIAHGTGTTVDLVGLQTQLLPAIEAVV